MHVRFRGGDVERDAVQRISWMEIMIMSYAQEMFSDRLVVEDKPHELVAMISANNARLITIDGGMAVGKTPLGRFISSKLYCKHHDLDDFLTDPGKPFLQQLDYPRLKESLRTKQSVVSGICMMAGLTEIGLSSDFSIYVLRKSEIGIPEEWNLIRVDQEPDTGMPHFGRASLQQEIWRYHQQYRPLTKATVLYLSDGKSIPVSA